MTFKSRMIDLAQKIRDQGDAYNKALIQGDLEKSKQLVIDIRTNGESLAAYVLISEGKL